MGAHRRHGRRSVRVGRQGPAAEHGVDQLGLARLELPDDEHAGPVVGDRPGHDAEPALEVRPVVRGGRPAGQRDDLGELTARAVLGHAWSPCSLPPVGRRQPGHGACAPCPGCVVTALTLRGRDSPLVGRPQWTTSPWSMWSMFVELSVELSSAENVCRLLLSSVVVLFESCADRSVELSVLCDPCELSVELFEWLTELSSCESTFDAVAGAWVAAVRLPSPKFWKLACSALPDAEPVPVLIAPPSPVPTWESAEPAPNAVVEPSPDCWLPSPIWLCPPVATVPLLSPSTSTPPAPTLWVSLVTSTLAPWSAQILVTLLVL